MARRALEASSSLSSRLLFSSTIAFLTRPISSPLHDSNRHVQTLAYEEIQASPSKPFNRTAFVFHGLLGSGRNWRTFSRSLATELEKRSPENGILDDPSNCASFLSIFIILILYQGKEGCFLDSAVLPAFVQYFILHGICGKSIMKYRIRKEISTPNCVGLFF